MDLKPQGSHKAERSKRAAAKQAPPAHPDRKRHQGWSAGMSTEVRQKNRVFIAKLIRSGATYEQIQALYPQGISFATIGKIKKSVNPDAMSIDPNDPDVPQVAFAQHDQFSKNSALADAARDALKRIDEQKAKRKQKIRDNPRTSSLGFADPDDPEQDPRDKSVSMQQMEEDFHTIAGFPISEMDGRYTLKQTALLSLLSARQAVIKQPFDVDVAQKATMVINRCEPIIMAEEEEDVFESGLIMTLWNSTATAIMDADEEYTKRKAAVTEIDDILKQQISDTPEPFLPDGASDHILASDPMLAHFSIMAE